VCIGFLKSRSRNSLLTPETAENELKGEKTTPICTYVLRLSPCFEIIDTRPRIPVEGMLNQVGFLLSSLQLGPHLVEVEVRWESLLVASFPVIVEAVPDPRLLQRFD